MSTLRVLRVWINGGRPNKGYIASVCMDLELGWHAIQVRDMRLIQKRDGEYILAMPSRKRGDGSFVQVFRPLNRDTEQFLLTEALSEYRRLKQLGHVSDV